MISESLVYNISLLEAELPYFTIELQVVEGSGDQDQDQGHLVRLVEELAIKCRTVASVHSKRCTTLGAWTAGNSLLFIHIDLQNVKNNTSDNRKIHRESIAKQSRCVDYSPIRSDPKVEEVCLIAENRAVFSAVCNKVKCS